jgi:Flp pilus assembly protein TadG
MRCRAQDGAVTAETAVVLPVLILMATAMAWLVALGVAEVRAVDAARETARSAARGEPADASIAQGRRIAPDGARIEVTDRGDQVVVTVSAEVRGPGGIFGLVPGFLAHAVAIAAKEPDP